MELTVSIKEQDKIAEFLNMIKKMEYVEIINVKEGAEEIPEEHRRLLEDRLQRIDKGETEFKNWDLVREKYENKAF